MDWSLLLLQFPRNLTEVVVVVALLGERQCAFHRPEGHDKGATKAR
jgi:hypothetical protein